MIVAGRRAGDRAGSRDAPEDGSRQHRAAADDPRVVGGKGTTRPVSASAEALLLFCLARASGGMADAHGSGPCVRKDVGVQLPPCPLISGRFPSSFLRSWPVRWSGPLTRHHRAFPPP